MSLGTISILAGVILLVLLKLFFKDAGSSQPEGFNGVEQDDLFKEDLDFDPSWAVLSSNTHHSEDN
ncbi:MAG: hypothetical protein VR65_19585 [Desulfobulbaceae bacterium BRH_c16a]|nr:MAG: hypothetical protein VR65_19585 [Desulfobulbaceae bacterium BRH_c16a]